MVGDRVGGERLTPSRWAACSCGLLLLTSTLMQQYSKRYRLEGWFLDVFPKLFLGTLFGLIVFGAIWWLVTPPLGPVYCETQGDPYTNRFTQWRPRAEAWLDENVDGHWEPGEPPLPNVSFEFNRAIATSDSGGIASLSNPYDCPANGDCIVKAQPPNGFQLTTPQQARITCRADSAQFGFARTSK